MSSQSHSGPAATLDLSRWRYLPNLLMVAGGAVALLGLMVNPKQFGFGWLQAYMFFLSIALGGFCLVMLHHLFDASWSVPLRRINEHLATLIRVMVPLFIPILLLGGLIYPWMRMDPSQNRFLHAKAALLNRYSFFLVAVVCLGVWWFFAHRLKAWSLKQDETGAAECTYQMRKYAAGGIFAFGLTLTLAAIVWVKSLSFQWYSTMYGVYYFAESMWTTLATVYVLLVVLERTGHLKGVLHRQQYYLLGSLMLAFTIFYAYIHFSQYFVIWNANMPEETFWYVRREAGSWWDIGMLIVFGHFFIPFLALLRIDVKLTLPVMIPLCLWVWLMHFCDISFNIMPTMHPNGFVLHWIDLACLAFFAGLLAKVFIRDFSSHPPFPQRDPRFAEMMGVYLEPEQTEVAVGAGERGAE